MANVHFIACFSCITHCYFKTVSVTESIFIVTCPSHGICVVFLIGANQSCTRRPVCEDLCTCVQHTGRIRTVSRRHHATDRGATLTVRYYELNDICTLIKQYLYAGDRHALFYYRLSKCNACYLCVIKDRLIVSAYSR